MSDVTVEGGKYTFQQPEGDWKIHVLRYGKPWLIIEEGHNAIASLLEEHREALEALEARNTIIGKLGLVMVAEDAKHDKAIALLDRANGEIERLRKPAQENGMVEEKHQCPTCNLLDDYKLVPSQKGLVCVCGEWFERFPSFEAPTYIGEKDRKGPRE